MNEFINLSACLRNKAFGLRSSYQVIERETEPGRATTLSLFYETPEDRLAVLEVDVVASEAGSDIAYYSNKPLFSNRLWRPSLEKWSEGFLGECKTY